MNDYFRRKLNVVFNKSGSGSTSAKLCVPLTWLQSMGIDEENRKVIVYYNNAESKIVIEKLKRE